MPEAQASTDYPLQIRMNYADAPDYTCLAIVDSIRNIGFDDRSLAKPHSGTGMTSLVNHRHLTWVEEVRIVDSIGVARGSTVRLVVPLQGSTIKFPFVPGERYLVLATGQKVSMFVEPTSWARSGVVGEFARNSNEIAGFAAFETHMSKLSTGETPAWQIANSVADTLVSSTDASLRRTLSWFDSCGYPGLVGSEYVEGRKDLPFAHRLLSSVRNASAYRRSKVYQLLCRWHVRDMEEPYVQSLIDTSKLANSWTAPEDSFFGENLRRTPPIAGAADREWSRLTAEEWVTAIVKSKNPKITDYLLNSFDFVTSENENRQLAELLNGSDISLQGDIVNFFAEAYGIPNMGVLKEGKPGHSVWRNRDEAVGYWRSRFKVNHP